MTSAIVTSRLLQRGCRLVLRLGSHPAEPLPLHRLLGRRGIGGLAPSQPSGIAPAGRMRWGGAAGAAAPRPLAAALGSSSSPQRQRRRQLATHAVQQQQQQQQPWPDDRGAARLHSLRLAPPPRHGGLRLPPRLRALSPAWQQPGDERQQHQQHQQQRGHASQAPWWQFWRWGGDAAEGGGEELRPPAPLPAQPSAALDRELKTVNVAVAVNAVILCAKIVTWQTTGSG